jgi:hypothetical protein
LAVVRVSHVRFGSWLRKNSKIEFATGNFVSTSPNLENKSAGNSCRDKTIEKTILRAFLARTFSRSQGHSRPKSTIPVTSANPPQPDSSIAAITASFVDDP